jgi:hypothetical protein
MLLAVITVLAGVFFAATGRGGELSYEHADHAPLDLGPVSATDVALLRPPTALWGYNVQVTDEAFQHIARAMRDRDVTIAYLQQQLADQRLVSGMGLPPGAGHPQAGDEPAAEGNTADREHPAGQGAAPGSDAGPAVGRPEAHGVQGDDDALAAEEQSW